MSISHSSLADRYEAFLLDLDGVVFRGDAAIPGASETIEELRRRGRRIVFITNNSARTPRAVADVLGSLGVPASPDEVVTSAQAAVPLMRDLIGPGGTVFAVGEDGVRAALREGGFTVLEGEPDQADAVVVGWDRRADYNTLRIASVLVQRGARLVATNGDSSYPAPGRELWPGAGALLAVITETTGATAAVAGKPHRPLFDAALERAGTTDALVVGDRMDTDIAGASVAGLDAVLVLSGAAGPDHLLDHDALPVAILDDLSGLPVERPDVRVRPAMSTDEEVIRTLIKEAGLPPPEAGTMGDEKSATVIEADGGPVAAAAAEARNGNGYLHSVVVHDGLRGLGLGTLVVAAAVRNARRQGANRCFLLTEDASGFFSRLGFEPTDRNGLPGWIQDLSRECTTSSVAMRRELVQ